MGSLLHGQMVLSFHLFFSPFLSFSLFFFFFSLVPSSHVVFSPCFSTVLAISSMVMSLAAFRTAFTGPGYIKTIIILYLARSLDLSFLLFFCLFFSFSQSFSIFLSFSLFFSSFLSFSLFHLNSFFPRY